MLPATAISDEEKLYSLAAERLWHRFSLAQIQLATLNFDKMLVIGKGGFGKVYKGYIYGTRDTTARVVAIKRLDSFSSQGSKEFMTEIEMLSQLRHCHLVSLIGYCSDGKEMMLVYEYMSNGSVEHRLHKADTPLSWMDRLKISIGAARGLDYLHTGVGTQQGVIHRDVKSSNILLDENWAAKISDFGLSKFGPINQSTSYVSTLVKGTFGYLDPEYAMTGQLTRRSDVYAFGVVLFELLSGRQAVDKRFDEEERGLAKWAHKRVKERRLDQIVCPHIAGQISPRCLREFAQIADRCVNSCREARPTMADVVVALQQSMVLQQQFDSSAQLSGAAGFTNIMHKYLVFGSRHNSESSKEQEMIQDLRIFSYSDMEVATRNFSSDMLLGRGHYGEVFRGWLNKRTYIPSKLDDGLAIAIKRLYDPHKLEPHKFNMKILEEFRNANVVKVIGYCVDKDLVLIVYEFMHQGTIKDYLFGDERRRERHQLIMRVKIALGVARGLVYLRTLPQLADCSLQMHNILLDEEFNAKFSDLDVVMLVPSHHIPFYFHPSSSYYLKVKSGVFGFGVMLLELFTGYRIENSCDLTLTRHHLPGEYGSSMRCIHSALDERLKLNYMITKPALQFASLAQKCVLENSDQRPTLESVLEELEEIYGIMLKFENSSN